LLQVNFFEKPTNALVSVSLISPWVQSSVRTETVQRRKGPDINVRVEKEAWKITGTVTGQVHGLGQERIH
jgi:hypothetical protein